MSICPSCRKPVDARLTRCPWDGTLLGTVALDPLLGTALGGRYLLRKCIAERERIRLYTAEENATGRAVLATLVNTPRAGDGAAVERFRGRAEIGRSMDHPSCTVVRDYGLLTERQAFIIEEGEVWHQLGQELVLKGGRLPLSKALDLAIQMVEGLDHLHGKGLYNASVSSSSLRLVFDSQGALKLQIPVAEVIAHLLEDEQADLAEPSQALAQDLEAAARVLVEMLAGSGRPLEEDAPLPVNWANLGLEDEARAKLLNILERALGRVGQKFGSAWEMRRELESLTGRSRLGRYTLLHRIAVGGMGEIYLARAEGIEGLDLNRLCVIKTIRTSLVQSAEFVERFLAEARVLASLSHGNIVPVHDVGKVGSVFYIAMEYVAGKDLRKILSRAAREKKRMSVPLALFIAKELANGLAYAHRAKVQGTGGLVHRDVSPHNTLVSYEGEVKLIDFGLARAGADLNRPRDEVVMGKVCYISPEQARAEPLDQRTDIYSAGLVLFELLTGEPFFNQPTIEEVLEHVGNPTPEPPSARVPGIPREVDRICMRAMAPRRDDRYLSAGALRDDLTAELARLAPRTNPEEVGHFVRSLFAAEQRDEECLITDLSTAIPPVVLGSGSDSLPIGPEPTLPPQAARAGSEAISLLGRTPLPIQLATTLHEAGRDAGGLPPPPQAGGAALAPTLPGVSMPAQVSLAAAGPPPGSASSTAPVEPWARPRPLDAAGQPTGRPAVPVPPPASVPWGAVGPVAAAPVSPPATPPAGPAAGAGHQPTWYGTGDQTLLTGEVQRPTWRSPLVLLLVVAAVGVTGVLGGFWLSSRRTQEDQDARQQALAAMASWGSSLASRRGEEVAAGSSRSTAGTRPAGLQRDRPRVRPRVRPVPRATEPCRLGFRGGEGLLLVVDGTPVPGRLPLAEPLAISPGEHQIVVRGAGLEPYRERLVCSPGETLTVRLRLRAR